MTFKYPKLHDKEWLKEKVLTTPLRKIAEEVGCSYSAVIYATRDQGIIIPTRTTHQVKKDWSRKCREAYDRKWPNGRYGEESGNWRGGIWKNRHLLGRYNITIEEKQKMFNDQAGQCALCPNKFRDVWEAATDHDHRTKKVRGLLCRYCNIRMATVDNTEWLQKALIYQKRGEIN